MKVSRELKGRIALVVSNIESPFFTDEEKGEAIKHMLDLATLNGIPKDMILSWCRWLWNKLYEEVEE